MKSYGKVVLPDTKEIIVGMEELDVTQEQINEANRGSKADFEESEVFSRRAAPPGKAKTR